MVFKEAECICTCHTGLLPSIDVDMEDIPDLTPDLDDDLDDDELYVGEDALKDGDHIFIATIPCMAEFIRAISNILQCLAKVFHKNSQPKSFTESVPTHFHDFKDLFSKSSFNCLPNRKIWDHTIKLVPGTKASSCKVYPLTPNEQSEMDTFIHENLSSGRIHPSKSPMASPAFFIKKKDGTLRLVQNYQLLNALTIKD
jgi:hypothetical protein